MTISDLLVAEGYRVESASDGDAGFARAALEKFALIILDVMLPKKTGFEVCRQLRQTGIDTAILMLTAKTQVVDRVVGLKLGSEDLTKPFEPAELLARVETLLRRVNKENRVDLRSFQFGDVEIYFERVEVRKGGQPLTLATKDLQLLR